MDETKNDYATSGKKSYGKRPWWVWLIIYLIIGAFIYFLVYYLFLRGGTSLY